MMEVKTGMWKAIEGESHSYRDEYQRATEPSEYEYLVVLEGEYGPAVARFWNTDWGDEAAAMADLVATAPNLLNAAQRINQRIAEIPDPQLRYHIEDELADELADMRAAIARATGRETNT